MNVYFVACSNDYLVLNYGDDDVGVVFKFDEIVKKCTPCSTVVVEVEKGECDE